MKASGGKQAEDEREKERERVREREKNKSKEGTKGATPKNEHQSKKE